MLNVRRSSAAMTVFAAMACAKLYPSDDVLQGASNRAEGGLGGAIGTAGASGTARTGGAATMAGQVNASGMAGSTQRSSAGMFANAGTSGANTECRALGCTSSNCEGVTCDDQGRECSNGSCVCPGGLQEQACNNSKDDDCDGDKDCADDDCDAKACGANGRKCFNGTCVCPSGQTKEADCGNGADDDCDGKADCDDGDCNRESCAGGGRCCSGACVALTTSSNCGACGISCGSGYTCQPNHTHPNFYVCSCDTNAQCRSWGYGADATCWAGSGQAQCNCQCNSETGTTCTGQCTGGGICHMMTNENYCSY